MRRLGGAVEVGVVEEERLVALDAGQKGVDRFEELLADLVCGDVGRRAERPHLLAKPGDERREQRALVTRGVLQGLCARRRNRGCEDIAEGAVRVAGLLEAATAEDQPSLRVRLARDLRGEPRRAYAPHAPH